MSLINIKNKIIPTAKQYSPDTKQIPYLEKTKYKIILGHGYVIHDT